MMCFWATPLCQPPGSPSTFHTASVNYLLCLLLSARVLNSSTNSLSPLTQPPWSDDSQPGSRSCSYKAWQWPPANGKFSLFIISGFYKIRLCGWLFILRYFVFTCFLYSCTLLGIWLYTSSHLLFVFLVRFSCPPTVKMWWYHLTLI